MVHTPTAEGSALLGCLYWAVRRSTAGPRRTMGGWWA